MSGPGSGPTTKRPRTGRCRLLHAVSWAARQDAERVGSLLDPLPPEQAVALLLRAIGLTPDAPSRAFPQIPRGAPLLPSNVGAALSLLVQLDAWPVEESITRRTGHAIEWARSTIWMHMSTPGMWTAGLTAPLAASASPDGVVPLKDHGRIPAMYTAGELREMLWLHAPTNARRGSSASDPARDATPGYVAIDSMIRRLELSTGQPVAVHVAVAHPSGDRLGAKVEFVDRHEVALCRMIRRLGAAAALRGIRTIVLDRGAHVDQRLRAACAAANMKIRLGATIPCRRRPPSDGCATSTASCCLNRRWMARHAAMSRGWRRRWNGCGGSWPRRRPWCDIRSAFATRASGHGPVSAVFRGVALRRAIDP